MPILTSWYIIYYTLLIPSVVMINVGTLLLSLLVSNGCIVENIGGEKFGIFTLTKFSERKGLTMDRQTMKYRKLG